MKQPLLLAAVLVVTLYGNVSSDIVALGNAIHLSWTYTSTNITFTLVANTTGWASIGFSPHGGMEGADIVMVVAYNGIVTVQDRYATAMALPAMDPQQDYKMISGSFANGQLRATFIRLLETCDPNDAIIKNFTTKIILAYGTVDSSGVPQYHGVGQRTTTSVHLLAGDPAPPNDTGIFYIDTVPKNVSISSDRETTYWCSVVELPRLNNKTHVIETIPMITPGNEDIVHHMTVYICDAPVNVSVNSFDCFDGSDPGNQNNCTSLIGVWAVGGTNFRFPPDVGLPLVYDNFSKYVLIQTHYSNMGRVSGRVDASYLRFVATQSLRPIDAGIIQSGIVTGMLVPPNLDQMPVSGYCPSDCLGASVIPASGINIFAVFLHSHLLGRRITLRHFRPSQNITLPVVADDPSYDFDFQETMHLDSPRVVLPGDVFQTVCTMNSTGRNVATQGGPGTMQEMCLSFAFYYPKVGLQTCQSSPAWLTTPNHPIYQLLGKNYSSFYWGPGFNDGLSGANWSSQFTEALLNGYTREINGFYCRINRTDLYSAFLPPLQASSPLPVYTADTGKCQLTTASTTSSPNTVTSTIPANQSSLTTTAKSSGVAGSISTYAAISMTMLVTIATTATSMDF